MYKRIILLNYLCIFLLISNELLPLKSLLAQVNLTNAAGSNTTSSFQTPRTLKKFFRGKDLVNKESVNNAFNFESESNNPSF